MRATGPAVGEEKGTREASRCDAHRDAQSGLERKLLLGMEALQAEKTTVRSALNVSRRGLSLACMHFPYLYMGDNQ